MTRVLLFLLGCTIMSTASAQFGKDILKRAGQSASSKASQKLDQKIDEGLDNVIKGKKKKQKKENSDTKVSTPVDAAENQTTGGEMIINTSLRCAAGKTKMEKILLDTDGVISASIDINTGKIYITAGDEITVDELISLLLKNGIDANHKKATAKINPCAS